MYLSRGTRHPLAALRYLVFRNRRATKLQVRHVIRALGYETQDVDKYHNDLRFSEFPARVFKAASPFTDLGAFGEDLYVMLRMIRPEIVVETGVFRGCLHRLS